MHLITPLMTGVRGAKNGAVFAYERGTETPAPVWADASGKVRRYGALRLDSLGSMALYVDRLVDVVVRDAKGELVREWTDGRSDGAVTVDSDAFTVPTLEEALDKLFPSAGAPDWNVLFRGAATPVQLAVGDLAGTLFDVRAFGAKGDDNADDLGAIQAAIETARAAGGGIVYLPAGTYRLSWTLALYGEVSLAGDANATTLAQTNELSPLVWAFGGDPGAPAHSLSNLRFVCMPQASLSAQPLVQLVGGSALISNCSFDGTSSTGPLLLVGDVERVRVVDSVFGVVTPTSAALDSSASAQRVNVDTCWIRDQRTRETGALPLVGTKSLHLDGCSFEIGLASSIPAECILAGGDVNAFVDGCDVKGSADTVTLLRTGTLFDASNWLFEDCSLFDTANPFQLYSLVDEGADAAYYARLKTVEARHTPTTEDTAVLNTEVNRSIPPDASQYGVFSYYNKTSPPGGAFGSGAIVGAQTEAIYASNMNRGRTVDVLYYCVAAEEFTHDENRFRNSVVPRWNFKANSLFAFRMLSSRALGTVPVAGDITRLHCLSHSASPATVNPAEREGYGPI